MCKRVQQRSFKTLLLPTGYKNDELLLIQRSVEHSFVFTQYSKFPPILCIVELVIWEDCKPVRFVCIGITLPSNFNYRPQKYLWNNRPRKLN